MNIFTKFHIDGTRIVDFLLIAKFLASANNFVTPSTIYESKTTYFNVNYDFEQMFRLLAELF